MADADDIREATGSEPGSLGPLGLKHAGLLRPRRRRPRRLRCGANEAQHALTRASTSAATCPNRETVDIRNVVEGDPTPGGSGTLKIARGIEVGHIFQLGTKYSDAMDATVQDQDGKDRAMTMGCYGIGITRIVGAAIEQNHDDNGIIWPEPLAPFDVVLVPINLQRSAPVREAAEALYAELQALGLEVLFDDRDVRPGVKFADAELIGIPHRVVLSERGLAAGELEYRHRRDAESRNLKRAAVLELLQK